MQFADGNNPAVQGLTPKTTEEKSTGKGKGVNPRAPDGRLDFERETDCGRPLEPGILSLFLMNTPSP